MRCDRVSGPPSRPCRKTTAVKVIALYGEGRTFIAGADIREFGKPPKDPWLPDMCNFIEDSKTPVVCVLHGTTLGGGLEVALASHVRVALLRHAGRFAGSHPGHPAGCGRHPARAAPCRHVAASLDLITSGKPVSVRGGARPGPGRPHRRRGHRAMSRLQPPRTLLERQARRPDGHAICRLKKTRTPLPPCARKLATDPAAAVLAAQMRRRRGGQPTAARRRSEGRAPPLQ